MGSQPEIALYVLGPFDDFTYKTGKEIDGVPQLAEGEICKCQHLKQGTKVQNDNKKVGTNLLSHLK
jgi:hypothetical protein